MMDPCTFVTECCQEDITSKQFWTAVNIWHENPHFLCRSLCGSISLFCGTVLSSHATIQLAHEVCKLNVYDARDGISICELLNKNGINVEERINTDSENDSEMHLVIKRLIPKKINKFQDGLVLTIFDRRNGVAVFSPLNRVDVRSEDLPIASVSSCTYLMRLVGSEMQLCITPYSDQLVNNALSSEWLKLVMFPKLVKWANMAEPTCSHQLIRSLSLISIDEYVTLYEELKDKYGKKMVAIWPENTDPAKFVYEDVAIATYILLLWKLERLKKGRPDWKQTFVDLGCGNGLLVYILSEEGHQGLGLDVRKRGIWDIYPDTTKLEVSAINPVEGCVFSNYDWLIGNHSDELTPWIPVLTNRTSYECSFFLLPCCFYDFAGNKYQRKDTSRSQYAEYLDFVHKICDTCGFDTQVDKLRIPSTKRTCLVGTIRTYPPEDSFKIDMAINSLINSRCEGNTTFKPRDSIEKVRNCTRLKNGVIDDVLLIVLNELLKKEVEGAEYVIRQWNAGGKATLKELANAIPKKTLLELKNECGGLQTLLRNKRHLFVVCQGLVYLRDPTCPVDIRGRSSSSSQKTWKKREVNVVKKLCWFNDNHPNGCPLSSDECMFQH